MVFADPPPEKLPEPPKSGMAMQYRDALEELE